MLLPLPPLLPLLLPVVLAFKSPCRPLLITGATDTASATLAPGFSKDSVMGGAPLTLTLASQPRGLLLLLLPLLLLLLLPPLLLPRVLALLLTLTAGHGSSLDGGFSLFWPGTCWTMSGCFFCRTRNASRQASFSPCHTSPGSFLDLLMRFSL